MFTVLVAIAVSCPTAAEASPQALWIEAEAYCMQGGSRGADEPPFASDGRCLGSNWGGRKDHFVIYRFRLDRPRDDAVLHIRYARQPADDSFFDVFCDKKLVAKSLAFPSTAGWGHLRDDEWHYRTVPLGKLGQGWHELKLVSAADKNNTNLDGFFLAGASFVPPNKRAEIDPFPGPPLRRARDQDSPECVDAKMSLDDVSGRLDDWYYPRNESRQRAALKVPSLVEIAPKNATLAKAKGMQAVSVAIGDEFDGWRIAETLADPEPIAVLEREFDNWGLIVFLGTKGVVAEVRKAVGRIEAVRRPPVRFPKDYVQKLRDAKEDVLGEKVLASGRDPSYEAVAGFLPPLETYTFLGSPQSLKKYIVQPDGSIGHLPNRWGGSKPLENTLFDPNDLLPAEQMTYPLTAKRGLLGGYLPAVDYGFLDAEARFGWELCALMDVGESAAVFIRMRQTGGQTAFYQLAPLRKLNDGKAFFAALLRVEQWWKRFFARGMRLEVDDCRTVDVARASIARALSGYPGLHPKYGMGGYWGATDQHDGFPPTTLSLGNCLLDWGLTGAAGKRLGYYLDNFVRADGTLKYYGPAVAEYGQIVDLAVAYVRRTADMAWFEHHRPAIERIVGHLLGLRSQSKESQSPDGVTYGLLFGGAEADNRKQTDYYFSGSVWCWRGLLELGRLYVEIGKRQNNAALARRGEELLAECKSLKADILRSVERSIVSSDGKPFLPPIAGFKKPFATMTQDRLASYTNYRYWPEALSACCLGPQNERAILDYRLARGGELLALTRFAGHLDDWPYWHHAYAVLTHDRVKRYLLGCYGHVAHHQTPGTMTAYEQVRLAGHCFRREYADYCVPAQLIAPLMIRWMLAFEERDDDVLWLFRAVPRAWLEERISFRGALTRWGPVACELKPSGDLKQFTARIELAGRTKPAVALRVRHPKRLRITDCRVEGGRCEKIDAGGELVRLRAEGDTMTARLTFER